MPHWIYKIFLKDSKLSFHLRFHFWNAELPDFYENHCKMIKKFVDSMIYVIIKHRFTHFIKYLRIDFYCFNFFFLNLGIISVFLRFYYGEAFVNKMKKNKNCGKAVVVFLLCSGTLFISLITPTYKLQIVNKKVSNRFLFKSQNFTTIEKGSVGFLLSTFINLI